MVFIMCECGDVVVDVKKEFEEDYVDYCVKFDFVIWLLCDCIIYYNGYGEVVFGSLVYYGGGQWYKCCIVV